MIDAGKLNRRQLLRASAGTLLAAGVWPGSLFADGTDKAEGFHFLVVNDVHYLNRRCEKWLDKVVAQMKGHAESIDFCLLVGDLGEHGKKDQMAAVWEFFKKLDMRTYVVIGNHDYLTQTDRKPFEKLFPGRLNYRFEHRGWQFVALDTTEGQLSRNTKVQQPTLNWLDAELPKLEKRRPTVILTHFPLGPLVPGRPDNAKDVLERFKEYNLQAVYNGHWHGFTERKVGRTVLTTNTCCSSWRPNHDGTKKKGYFLCHAKDGVIQRRFLEVTPV